MFSWEYRFTVTERVYFNRLSPCPQYHFPSCLLLNWQKPLPNDIMVQEVTSCWWESNSTNITSIRDELWCFHSDFKKHSLELTGSESRSHSSRAVRTCQGKFDVTQSKSFHPPRSPRVTVDWHVWVTVCECLGPVSDSCWERMREDEGVANVHAAERRFARRSSALC